MFPLPRDNIEWLKDGASDVLEDMKTEIKGTAFMERCYDRTDTKLRRLNISGAGDPRMICEAYKELASIPEEKMKGFINGCAPKDVTLEEFNKCMLGKLDSEVPSSGLVTRSFLHNIEVNAGLKVQPEVPKEPHEIFNIV